MGTGERRSDEVDLGTRAPETLVGVDGDCGDLAEYAAARGMTVATPESAGTGKSRPDVVDTRVGVPDRLATLGDDVEALRVAVGKGKALRIVGLAGRGKSRVSDGVVPAPCSEPPYPH